MTAATNADQPTIINKQINSFIYTPRVYLVSNYSRVLFIFKLYAQLTKNLTPAWDA